MVCRRDYKEGEPRREGFYQITFGEDALHNGGKQNLRKVEYETKKGTFVEKHPVFVEKHPVGKPRHFPDHVKPEDPKIYTCLLFHSMGKIQM